MNSLKTRSLVQGAMIAAMFGALSLFNTYSGGLLDVLLCYVMVVPIAWYGTVYNIRDNIIVCFVSLIVIFMFGLPTFIISSFSSCLIGLFLGEALRRKASKEVMMVGTLLICIFNNILLYEVFSGLVDMNLVEEISEIYDMIKSVYPSLSVSLDYLLRFIPLFVIIMSALEMYVILTICQLIFERLRIKFPKSFNIVTMHFSIITGIVLVICFFGSYLLLNVAHYDSVVLNYIYIIAYMALALQGFSFGCYYIVAKQRRWMIIILFVLLFIPYGVTFYLILGIIDIFSDLRIKLAYN